MIRGRLLLPFVLPLALVSAQTSLLELPMLARGRAERQRPTMEKALEPYWADLRMDYRENARFLDGRLAKVAELGDAVVPLLLEKLTPADASGPQRHLATNCTRVLQRLDPASFLDALIELVNGTHDLGRAQAIVLLGHAQTPRAVEVLTQVLDQCQPGERTRVVEALTTTGNPAAAGKVVGLLGSDDRDLRGSVLEYLTAAKAAAVIDTVLAALSVEKEPRLMMRYVEYLGASARGHDAAARRLLPLLERDKLDWSETRRLLQVLGTVAPKDHDPTCKKLHEMLDAGETSPLALQAALTLRDLDDKSGIQKLQKGLTEHLRKPQRKREAGLYELRGNLFFAIEDIDKAIDDYENVVGFTESSAQRRKAELQLARCEARRGKWTNVLKHLREAAPAYGEMVDLAKEDLHIEEALRQEKIKAWLQTLAK